MPDSRHLAEAIDHIQDAQRAESHSAARRGIYLALISLLDELSTTSGAFHLGQIYVMLNALKIMAEKD